MITQLRSKTSPLRTATPIKKIAFMGHSYCSAIGTQVSTRFPADADAIIHTGLAILKPDQFALPSQLAANYVPASTYDPTRFPPATYGAPGYLVASSKPGRQASFYSHPVINFDPAKYDRDSVTEATITTGETLTQNIYNSTAYINPVFVLTGQQDAVFCGLGSRDLGPAHCGSEGGGGRGSVKAFYPAVAEGKFAYDAQPNAGHCLQIHCTAPAGFAKAHAFLAQQGL